MNLPHGNTTSGAGAKIAIAAFVFTQFVEVTFFVSSGFEVTLQKVVAILILPAAAVMMRRIQINIYVLAVTAALIAAFSGRYLLVGDLPSSDVLAGDASVVTGSLGAIVLYSALTQTKEAWPFLMRVWVWLAVVTSAVTVLQAVHLLPLWTVPDSYIANRQAVGGLYRGVGFKFDPNFQALVLVIGAVLNQTYAHRFRVLITLVLFAGVLATFSRMGALVTILVVATTPLIQARAEGRPFGRALVRGGALLAMAGVFVVGVYLLGPKSVAEYIDIRVTDLQSLSGSAAYSGGQLNSAQVRLLLARASWGLALKNWPLGVGAYQSNTFLYDVIGIKNWTHNTYLELFLTGGLFGLLTLGGYFGAILSAMQWRATSFQSRVERGTVLALILAFGLIGGFLSLMYNAVFWLPLVLALAYRKRTSLKGSIT